jgi:hypothetical protein
MIFDQLPSLCLDLTKVLHSNKIEKIESYIQSGANVRLRLDIPAYNEHGAWVVTVHDSKWKVIRYCGIAKVTSAKMTVRQKESLNIYNGVHSKSPMAAISGKWQDSNTQELLMLAQEMMIDSDCVQVGYNPHRHSFFFDRATMLPVVAADEVIQVGGLIMAKHPTYGKLSDFLY